MSSQDADPAARAALRAVAHPVRLQMLSLLTGAELSAAEVARELDLTHANASYHLRVLADAGEVVIAGEEKIRGGVAKRYRHPWDKSRGRGAGEHPRAKMSAKDRQAHMRVVAEELVRRSRRTSSETPAFLTDAELWVPAEVWSEVSSLVGQASELLHAEARPPRTQETVHVNMTAVLFQMDD